MDYNPNFLKFHNMVPCPAGYRQNCIESGEGVFITDNVVVTITVEDYHVTARDVGRYGG